MDAVEASPITGVHLWFDRPIMPYDHAVLVDRLSQWVFHRSTEGSNSTQGYYYQVVVSASRGLAGRDRNEIVGEVCAELAAIWPAATAAKCLHGAWSPKTRLYSRSVRVSTSCGQRRLPTFREFRLQAIGPQPAGPRLWKERCVSGYLAAESILRTLGRPTRFVVEDLPRGLVARWLIKG